MRTLFVTVALFAAYVLTQDISDAEVAQDTAADTAQAPIDAAMVAFGSNVFEAKR